MSSRRKPRKKPIASAAAAVVAAIGTGSFVLVSSHSACACNVTKANVWVSTTGNDGSGTRSASLVADPGTDFLTFNAAYQATSPGDTIAVNCGSYGAQTILQRSSPAEAAPAVVIAPAAPRGMVLPCVTVTTASAFGTVSQTGPSYLAFNGSNSALFAGALSISSATHITIDRTTITSSVHTTGGSALVLGFGATPDDSIRVLNSTVYSLAAGSTSCTGATVCTGGSILVSGGTNVTIGPNTTVGPTCCAQDGIDVYYGSGTPTNFKFTRSTINGIYDTCSLVPAVSIPTGATCTGYGIGNGCDSANCEHDDGFAIGSCITCTIEYSQLWNAGAQPMFAKTFGGGPITSLVFKGNFVAGNGAPTSGSGGVNIGSSCTPNCYSGTNKFLYNTLVGVGMRFYTLNDDGAQSWAAASTVQVTGNLAVNALTYGIETVNGVGTHVASCGGNGSNATFTFTYNWLANDTCSGGTNADISTKVVNLTSVVFPYNLHLLGANDATGAGESTFCGAGKTVSTDPAGHARVAPCTIGGGQP